MLPGGYSASNSETTSQSGQNKGAATSGASGGSRGVVTNIAFPGAKLAADTGGDGGSVPVWVWIAGLGVLGAAVFIMWKR